MGRDRGGSALPAGPPMLDEGITSGAVMADTNLMKLVDQYSDEDSVRAFLEALRSRTTQDRRGRGARRYSASDRPPRTTEVCVMS